MTRHLQSSLALAVYAAHIDRDANGIIAVLGTIPDSGFSFYELHDSDNIEEYSERYNIPKDRFIISSDAHYLTDMRDGECFFEIDCDEQDEEAIRHALFDHFRR